MKKIRSNDALFLVVLASSVGSGVACFEMMSASQAGHVAAASEFFGPWAVGFLATLAVGGLLGLFGSFSRASA